MTMEQTKAVLPAAIEQVLISGDLSPLSPEQRLTYYNHVCESVGLNPLTRPFDYIKLNGKLTLYAKKDCTDQLRKLKSVSLEIKSRELIGDVFVVTAQATLPRIQGEDRTDEAIGAVSVKGLSGDALANAYMKAETKAKRRVTLSICGLGILDESEADTIPGAELAPKNVTPIKKNLPEPITQEVPPPAEEPEFTEPEFPFEEEDYKVPFGPPAIKGKTLGEIGEKMLREYCRVFVETARKKNVDPTSEQRDFLDRAHRFLNPEPPNSAA